MRPVTAQPGYSESDLAALQASGQFVIADCYTITPKVGTPLRFTTAQIDVSVVPVGGVIRVTYKANSINIAGLQSHTKIGVEVDSQTIALDYPASLEYQNRLSFPQALLQGMLDGARIRRDQFVAAEWDGQFTKWVGGYPMFDGLVSTCDMVGRQSASLTVKSDLVLLDTQMPRKLWQTGCTNVWGDAACGVVQSDWAVVGTVTSGTPTRTFLPWTSSSSEYALGKLYIDNYDSVTRIRTVLKSDTTGIWLVYPLDFTPVVGQTFTAYPGDDRTLARCQHFHPTDYKTRYNGYPFVPVSESAY